MSAVKGEFRTPALARIASRGQPARAWPRARVPSKLRRRCGSRARANSACRTSAVPSSHRSSRATWRAIMFQPKRPRGSRHQSAPRAATPRRASSPHAPRSPTMAAAMDWRISRWPRVTGVVSERSAHQVAWSISSDEAGAVDEDVAPPELEHRLEVVVGDRDGDGGDGLDRRGLLSRVVEPGHLGREQVEGLARLAGEDPVVDRRRDGGGGLEPLGRPGVLPGGPFGLALVEVAPQRRAERPGQADPPIGVVVGQEHPAVRRGGRGGRRRRGGRSGLGRGRG